MIDTSQFVRVSFEQVRATFEEMQKARGEQITSAWYQDAQVAKWYCGKVDPAELLTPYSEFRGLVSYSKRGLRNREALAEILRSRSDEAKLMVTGGLTGAPSIIVWLRPDGVFQVDDGCRRSLSATHLGLREIDAFIGIHANPARLDYWKDKPLRFAANR